MKIKLDEFAFMPERAHSTDAGLDLKAPHSFTISPHSAVIVDTGVHVELPRGTVGMLKSKSGLNVKSNITSEGVIDEGYTGSIVAKLYNHGDEAVLIDEGQKITQLVILPVIIPDIEIVEGLTDTERGANGFGSSGK
jgi:dUTP pyrophosphatase